MPLAPAEPFEPDAAASGHRHPPWHVPRQMNVPRRVRGGVTYCAPLGRYLWVQILPGGDTRFAGGFGVYDAPEPWGPWTTAFFTEAWDVGPGETASFPVKWMSADGRTLYLVFSGEDAFSVRRATLEITR